MMDMESRRSVSTYLQQVLQENMAIELQLTDDENTVEERINISVYESASPLTVVSTQWGSTAEIALVLEENGIKTLYVANVAPFVLRDHKARDPNDVERLRNSTPSVWLVGGLLVTPTSFEVLAQYCNMTISITLSQKL
ncbi:hypothetical protein PsorP6_012507 [Peronosclerospora sorghi]|uniref:Uncharacterized protein n=1 Tax=Peronosclerospora sorghi TaxID=230839 RepID=A0ACC0WH34_9STRA|nr:hypothetical protein PsorP6_012507 [Peronosclerospora sorghi]